MLCTLIVLALTAGAAYSSGFEVRDDLHFHAYARATNKDGSVPVYKDPTAAIEDRVNDLLPRMTLQEKVSQLYVHKTLLLPFSDDQSLIGKLSSGFRVISTAG